MAKTRLVNNLGYEYVLRTVYSLNVNELKVILETFNQEIISGNKQSLCQNVLNLLSDSLTNKKHLRQKIIEVCKLKQQKKLSNRQLDFSITSLSSTPIQQLPRPVNIIKFETLPFFKTVDTLLKPIYCNSYIGTANLTVTFYLTDNVRNLIAYSWNDGKQEYNMKIILRLVQIEIEEKVNKHLPYNLSVSVYKDSCPLPKKHISKTTDAIPWQCNIPIDITEQTDLIKPYAKNYLNIIWSEDPHEYMAGLYVVQKLTVNDLVKELKTKPLRSSDLTKEFILKLMEHDAELDTSIDTIICTIMDPLTLTRMKLPSRGVACKHLECFDAITFLEMNEHKDTWVCPICKKVAKFENIEIDEFFLNVLQSTKLSKGCKSIILLKDGSWTEKKLTAFSNGSKPMNNQKIDVVTLSDDSNDGNIQPNAKRPKYGTLKIRRKGKK